MSASRDQALGVVIAYQSDPGERGQGGGVRFVQNLAWGLAERGWRVLFLGSGTAAWERDGVRFVPVTAPGAGYPRFLVALWRRLRSLDLSDYHVAQVNRSYFGPPFVLARTGLPIACTLHGRTMDVAEKRLGPLTFAVARPFLRIAERLSLSMCDTLISVSRRVDAIFESRYPRLMARRRERRLVVPSMIDDAAFRVRESTWLQDRFGGERRYLLMAGRLDFIKDIQFVVGLLRGELAREPQLHLALAGDGPQRGELEAIVAAAGFEERVHFLGEVPHDEMPEVISSASVLVLSSISEGSPTVVKEALACGVPVVTNDVGDVRLVVVDGANGEVVVKSAKEYARALSIWAREEVDKEAVRSASEHVLEPYWAATVVARYDELLTNLARSDLRSRRRSDDGAPGRGL